MFGSNRQKQNVRVSAYKIGGDKFIISKYRDTCGRILRAEVSATKTRYPRPWSTWGWIPRALGGAGMHYAWRHQNWSFWCLLDITSRISVKDTRCLCFLFLKFCLRVLVVCVHARVCVCVCVYVYVHVKKSYNSNAPIGRKICARTWQANCMRLASPRVSSREA